ncbi:Uncharacterized protein TPAR_06695 [Tolypocladium paradoxum]|uniref:Alpha/beta hydrolase fold-3 domain-containing protein n=1 Tax=Tolypocladium paradoxum TaxID=94208 RepID=A0A2S4KSB6_9HYPO|nr:Uncharacterized protein TPAR_06695 [Tolypocladium paradoxum]
MRRWTVVLRAKWSPSCQRAFGTRRPERVDVRCGSAGHVTIDLFNAPENSPESALLIHLPPFPSSDDSEARLPEFLQHLPVASINYRWAATSQAIGQNGALVPLCWPTPTHDTAFAFAWLLETLAPPKNGRRDIYVYGSHLGASLATSLALVEAHSHARFGVRGVVAYNGIYNWTMFLPDHRINKPPTRPKKAVAPAQPAEGSHLHRLQDEMPGLFDDPTNLFDPFASPSLFFHSPGLVVPRSFSMSMEDAANIDRLTKGDDAQVMPLKPPRKSHLIFPPRKSTLKIPETLLLYDSQPPPPPPPTTKTGRTRRRAKTPGNTFEAQAEELAELMRRSVDVVELKERSKWDEDIEDKEDEAHRRVQLVGVGPETKSIELSDGGQQAALTWLQHRS